MPDSSSPTSNVLSTAQQFLALESLSGWLVYDYRHSNPIFWQLITPSGHVTRRCFLHVPPASQPELLVQHVDAGKFAQSGTGLRVYRNRQEMIESLTSMLAGVSQVAMEYSPLSALPRVSRVDAGTIELVRGIGVEVVSSADLMQFVTQRWSPQQLEGHRRSAAKLGQIVNEAFQFTGDQLGTSGEEGPTEFQVAEFIRGRFRDEGLESPDGPIVATNAHDSDPHFEPAARGSSVIQPGDWMLIDLWAKAVNPPPSPVRKGGDAASSNAPMGSREKDRPYASPSGDGDSGATSPLTQGGVEGGQPSIYADITWVAYIADAAPERHQEIFNIVTGARDAALEFLVDSFQQGVSVQG